MDLRLRGWGGSDPRYGGAYYRRSLEKEPQSSKRRRAIGVSSIEEVKTFLPISDWGKSRARRGSRVAGEGE